MINLPQDVLENILRFLDPISLSQMCQVHPMLNEIIQSNKWRIIDNSPEDLKLIKAFPATKETFNTWRYLLDLTACLSHHYENDEIISEDVLLEFIDNQDMNWALVCSHQKLSEETLRSLHPMIPLTSLLTTQELSIDLLDTIILDHQSHWNDAYWYYIFAHQKIDYSFITKYMAHVDWHAVSQNKHAITMELIANHVNNLVWPEITKHGLAEELVETRLLYGELDMFSWINIAMHSKLSTSFIQKHLLNLPVIYLVRCQDLEQDLIQYIVHADNNYDDDLMWNTIAEFQRLSFEFIYEHKNKLSLTFLIRNVKIKRFDLARMNEL